MIFLDSVIENAGIEHFGSSCKTKDLDKVPVVRTLEE